MSSTCLLLQRGTLLQHDAEENVNVLRDTDLLIVDKRIEQIGRDLTSPEGCQIIDCRNKIICPGFIDTHHHVWQTQLKGRHSDDTLLDYTTKGNMQCYNYTPQDVFWGELAGCLEAVDAGTTCVVDHAHMTYSQDHGLVALSLAGLSATITSGIRSIFCYSVIPRLKRWDTEVEAESVAIPDWSIAQLQHLARRQPLGDGRVTIGLGFDMFDIPEEQVKDLFRTARTFGVKTITSHWRKNNIAGSGDSVPALLHKYSLLGPDILLSHATGSSESDFALLKSSGTGISCTPSTESQMAHGELVGFRPNLNASLGADCHSANSTSMLHSMQIGLAVARSHRSERILDSGKFPRNIEPRTLDAFNLATIRGARVLGMDGEIGSLTVGKKADIAIFRTDTPAMACAFEEHPLVAVVRHAGTREIETVIVDGIIRKTNGELVDVELEPHDRTWEGRDTVENLTVEGAKLKWSKIMTQLLRSREEIQRRIDHCDVSKATKITLRRWGASEGDDVFG